MAANLPTSTTGSWTIVSGKATIQDPTNPITAVSVPLGETAVLSWTINNGLCAVSSSTVQLTNNNCLDGFFIPTLFTPNGDSINDTFEIRGLDKFAQNDLIIVNRNGNEVYHASNYKNDWAGTGLNEGTYFYVLRVKENAGSDWKVFKGYTTIIRSFKK